MPNYRERTNRPMPDMSRRIDTRPQNDPAVASGAYGLHRDTRGNVIGGYDNYGRPFGTKARNGNVPAPTFQPQTPAQATPPVAPSATPRLDAGVQTPGLDSNPRQPVRYTSAAQIAGEQQEAARAGALRGDFGIAAKERADNLEGRKSLFRDMQVVGRGGLTPELRQRAAALGVDERGWNNATGKLTAAPASIAAPAPANPNVLVMGADGYARLAGGATAPTNPDWLIKPPAPVGAAKARADIAKHGLQGAVDRKLASMEEEKRTRNARMEANMPSLGSLRPAGFSGPNPFRKYRG